MKHVWTLDESPARAGRRPGALAEYKALRDASCVWRPAVLSNKLLILRNDGQTEVEGTHITECVVDAPGADGTAVFLIRRLGVPATGAPLSVEPGMWARWELSKLTFPPELVDASGETSRDFVTFSLRIFFLVQSLESAKLITPTVPPIARWSEVDFPRCKSRLLHFLGRTSALSYFGSFACPAILVL